MNICGPKTNIAFTRDAVKRELLLPDDMIKNLKKTELCKLLALCTNDRLPAAPFMLEPKRVGNYMIAVYSNSPFTPAEFVTLLGTPLPTLSAMKKFAKKLNVTVTRDQGPKEIRNIILDKLVTMGIPEPIKVGVRESKTAMANGNMGEVAQNIANRGNNGARANNGNNGNGARANNGNNGNGNGARANNGNRAMKNNGSLNVPSNNGTKVGNNGRSGKASKT
jgi:hypothetical protein